MKRIGSILLSLALVLAMFPVTASAVGPQVTLTTSKQNVAIGETFTVTVSVNGASDVYGSAVEVVYNPATLSVSAATPGTLVTQGLAAGSVYTSTLDAPLTGGRQRTTALALRLGDQLGAGGNGTIAVFTFTAQSAGTITFDPSSTLEIQMVTSAGDPISFAGPAPVTVNVGMSGPVITAPPSNTYGNNRTVAVTGEGASDTAVIPVLDGTDKAAVPVNTGGAFSFNAVFAADGTHTIQVREQTTGLLSNQVSVVVDTVPPALTVNEITPAVSTTVSGSVFDFNFSALYVQVNPTGAPGASDAVTKNLDGTFSKAVTLVQDMENVVVVTAVDKAGNKAASERLVTVGSPGPVLKLVPELKTPAVGSTFTVDVVLSNAVDITGADVQVSFPPDLLEVVDANTAEPGVQVSPGTFIVGTSATNLADNINGTFRFAVATGSAVTGDGTVARATFRVKAAGTAAIQFIRDLSGTPKTELTDSGFALVKHSVMDTEVTSVTGGTVTGMVELQGRGSSARGGVTVKVIGHPIETTTAADGTFTLTGVPAGTQSLIMQNPGYLVEILPGVAVTAGQTVTLDPVVMKGGDANGDNKVSLIDLAMLAKSYGLSAGQTDYDDRCDFNDDQKVSLVDLAILASNYGVSGPAIPPGE